MISSPSTIKKFCHFFRNYPTPQITKAWIEREKNKWFDGDLSSLNASLSSWFAFYNNGHSFVGWDNLDWVAQEPKIDPADINELAAKFMETIK